ncbi:UvrB/UvrC motif-containing protein [Pelagicoccus sp. SDUM812002]|uniref:UvrB/UvrC motif-containing protein n=1 Tax=Pelagicoccus sp. SDUM812002 TaxID=3041266 RepID=UPI00280DF05A|nr:UvrB/UvrC motif-containing protein [Pelagicoccus sp. SDUM812002]MDQ8186193.1 UvrB/UvrC motif-containing protein [Pelagicoccus sp. SDUM812002]
MSESRPKNCSHCNAPTSIHLTKVVDGEAVKLGVCSNCPKAKAYKQGAAWDLIDAENGGKVPRSPKESERACPGCGLTPADFKEHGRLGCSKCYETFEGKLEPVINKLHRGSSHIGKVPRGKKRDVTPEEIADLKRRLDEYVSREEYEMAATVRDQIKALGE